MQTQGTQHLIERTYRESGQFQWVRELLTNSIEAGATRVEFSVEWQAVENKGIYRRVIADNGSGMTSEQLVEFFNTFGGGGKPIGGAHDNFGVGSKTSLLPWNRYGMVVISWVNGDASMIWVKQDAASEEYGLKVERCAGPFGEERLEPVYDPYYDPDHGCDWSLVKPKWIDDHGTVVVLLGNNPTDDTVEGDPNRDEKDTKGIPKYLNRRFWKIPEGLEVFVDEFRTNERANWPPSEEIAYGPVEPGRDRRINHRQIQGGLYHIEYPIARFDKGGISGKGTVTLRDGTEIDWYLWEGDRPAVHTHAAQQGYIAALYANELYDTSTHHSTFRLFGVSDGTVRQKLWLIIRPVVDPAGKHGVYPKTDRNSLLIKGGPNAGGALPLNEWAAEFSENMPNELIAALGSARRNSISNLEDDNWRERLAEKFEARWRLSWLRAKPGADHKTNPDSEGSPPIRRSKRTDPELKPKPEGGGSSGGVRKPPIKAKIYGQSSANVDAEMAHTTGTVPGYEPRGKDELGNYLAAWQKNHPQHPEGLVLINVDHPVIRSVVEYWQSQYADHYAADIEKDVITVYGQIAVSKVAHSEHLMSIFPTNTIEAELRSDGALTMALLGLVAEDHLIATKIGGKYSKKRHAVADKVPRHAR